MRTPTYLIACFLLIEASESSARAEDSDESASSLIVVISGFGSDASSEQLADKSPRGRGNSGMYQLVSDLKKGGLKTRFFNWNGTGAGEVTLKDAPGKDGIVSFIRDENSTSQLTHLVIIGHSWGGHTMLEVAEELKEDPRIDIALAIGVDPSSFSRGGRPKELPSTILSFVNYHTHNSFVWGRWPGDKRVVNVDLGDPSRGYVANSRRNYAARFDINAHNAAEWDELIHKDIVKRINCLVSMPETREPSINDNRRRTSSCAGSAGREGSGIDVVRRGPVNGGVLPILVVPVKTPLQVRTAANLPGWTDTDSGLVDLSSEHRELLRCD